jgi:hypothetical protein
LKNQGITLDPMGYEYIKEVALWLGGDSGIMLKKGENYRLPDGSTGEVRVCKANSHLRITWQPEDWDRPSTIQIRIISNGENAIVAFHQENLPDFKAREERRKFFVDALRKFEDILNAGE